MLRMALDVAAEHGRTSEEDTQEIIKLIIEWRGRKSIVTAADQFHAAEVLGLDADNAKALLDLYDIIGPGAGYKPPHHDEEGRTWLVRPKGHGNWQPTLTPTQDEVDYILLAVLGPNFVPPVKGQRGLPGSTPGSESSGAADDDDPQAATEEQKHGHATKSSTSKGRPPRRGTTFRAPSPIADSWQVESRNGKCVRIAVSHAGFTGSFNQTARRLTWLEELEIPALRPWFDPESAHELIPEPLRPPLALDIAASATLGYLPKLRVLNLHGNLLVGEIPSKLGSLSVLEELDLSRNRFTGGIPGEFGALANLTRLDVSNCRLDGTLAPSFLQNATALEVLSCNDNGLCGPLPSELLAGLTNLRELDLGANKFSGMISVEMPHKLRKCEKLNLSHNFIGGRLPSTMMDLISVTELDLSSNRFGGRLPLGLGCLKPTLQYLDISHNQYTEEEREELSKFLFDRLTAATPNIYI